MQEMDPFMEKALIALIIAGIIALIASIIYLRERTAASKEERRSMERRVGVLEDDVSLLKKVLVTLENLRVNIEHILKSQDKTDEKLTKLDKWQTRHQHIIEEAERFIHETNKDGVKSRE